MVSSIYLGIKEEYSPPDIPYINLPIINKGKLRSNVIKFPIIPITAVSIIHFLLPYIITFPPEKDPRAIPIMMMEPRSA